MKKALEKKVKELLDNTSNVVMSNELKSKLIIEEIERYFKSQIITPNKDESKYGSN